MTNNRNYGILSIPVIVGALGYFEDIYDLLLFDIVRKQSLFDLEEYAWYSGARQVHALLYRELQ